MELSTNIHDVHPIIQDHSGKDQTVFYLWFKRWAIGAIAKVFEAAQNPMLVLDGPQDLGKSSFVKWLVSGIGEQYYSERPLNLADKDMLVELLTQFVWEISEFGHALRKADVEQLKAFVTMGTVTVRPSYARRALRRPATASLVGTINSDGGGFLNDPTGSRRFLCITLDRINFNYQNSIDINQLWAEVLDLYRSGEPWQLAPSEKLQRQAINEQYEVQNPYEALLRKYFLLTNKDSDFMTTNDMREHLEDWGKLPKGNIRATQMALASAAKRCNLKKERRSSYGSQEYVIIGIQPKPKP